MLYRSLTDVYDGVRSGWIVLQYPQGKADQQQLHLGISAKQLIHALLGRPTIQMEHHKKQKMIKTTANQNHRLSESLKTH